MEIVYYPDPRLTAPNSMLGAWSENSSKKVEEMRSLVTRVGGAGLAAPQVGWNVRLFILSIAGNQGETRERVVFDPQITLLGERALMPEGCLSFPNVYGHIERSVRVRLVGETPEGRIDEVLSGFEAQAAQHEMDHLEGILFIEKMTPAERRQNAPFIRELEENWRRSEGK
jgi:peptide deformylase